MKWLATAIWIAGLVVLLYGVEQDSFPLILICFAISFAAYVLISSERYGLKYILVAALLVRLISLFSVPALSDDIYRFIWDGRTISQGLDPYALTPTEARPVIQDDTLYQQLNSKNYHSVYPVVSQAAFYLSSFAGQDFWLAVLIIRLFIGAFEIGLIWQLIRWFRRFHIPDNRIAWYALNPLVLIETYGNLHFEPVMAFFLLITLHQWRRPVISALTFALAAASKVLSLITLPFLVLALHTKRRWIFLSAAITLTTAFFLPVVLQNAGTGFFQSIGLYFRTFEFNAGVYYLLREAGYLVKGYNLIHIIGPMLGILNLLAILLLSYFHRHRELKDWPMVIAQLFTVYLLLSTTLHPWYVIMPLIFGVIAGYRYVVVWSFVATFSYHAYATDPTQESPMWLILEYGTLLLVIIIDVYKTIGDNSRCSN